MAYLGDTTFPLIVRGASKYRTPKPASVELFIVSTVFI